MRAKAALIVMMAWIIGCGPGNNPSQPTSSQSAPAPPEPVPTTSPPKPAPPVVEARQLDSKVIEQWTKEFSENPEAAGKKYYGTRWQFEYKAFGKYDDPKGEKVLVVGHILDGTPLGWSTNVHMTSPAQAKRASDSEDFVVIEAELTEVTPDLVVRSRFKDGRVVTPK